jgi:hypothetical protein
MSEAGLLADVYIMQDARKKPLTVDFNHKRLAGGKWLNEIRRAKEALRRLVTPSVGLQAVAGRKHAVTGRSNSDE